MSALANSSAELTVLTSHRLSGTSLAIHLQAKLGCDVAWQHPGEAPAGPSAILNSVHEEPASIPRIMKDLLSREIRTLLIYDDARPSEELLAAARELGVRGTFGVRGDPHVLANQVRDLIAGRTWSRDRAREQWSRSLESHEEKLTQREQDVVKSYYSRPGAAVEDVAEHLGISTNTVRVHLANVRRKLSGRHVGNRQALHTALIDKGWLD